MGKYRGLAYIPKEERILYIERQVEPIRGIPADFQRQRFRYAEWIHSFWQDYV